MKTHQEIFDFVAKALLAQGKPSFEDGYGCRYRSENGCKCAAGHLIPDNYYSQDMEGTRASGIVLKYYLFELEAFADDNIELIDALQVAHDDAIMGRYPVWSGAWVDNMRHVAQRFNLNTMVFDSL